VSGSLGRRYARALLGLARETGALAATGEELARATAVFAEPELQRVVLSPTFNRSCSACSCFSAMMRADRVVSMRLKSV